MENEAPESHNLGKRKRKRGDVSKANDDPKLQEFLDVMQPPSKSRTWANEGVAEIQKASERVTHIQMQKEEAGHSDEEYEAVPIKRKISKKSEDTNESVRVAENATSAAEATEDIRNGTNDSKDGDSLEALPRNASEPPSDPVPVASDENWLRSRTSRLLGLIDDDDALRLGPTPQAVVEIPEYGAVSKHPQGRKMSDTSVPIDEETIMSTVATAEHATNESENVDLSTGRLFIRNLMYTTTEYDLRKHFEAQNFGSIEEVGLTSSPLSLTLSLWSCDDYPDRDSLCYACDVTRKSILVDASCI